MKLILCLALVVLSPCRAPAQSIPTERVKPDTNHKSVDSVGTLHPGDIVRLRIWREPDLSGDFAVDEGGIVVFPKIGRLTVLGESPVWLKDTLVASYQVYLRNPSIDVILLRRVNVLGAVRNPGLYPVDPTMMLADVIAAAGGATPQGKSDEVQLLRGGKTVTANLTGGTRIADLQIRSGDQLFVPERSWVSRNSGVVAAALSATVSLFIALSR
jgi:protein involved in polysaccharide export with SLBB domain